MDSYSNLKDMLLHQDGSSRDITFTPTSLNRVKDFLRFLQTTYWIVQSHDINGNSVVDVLVEQEFEAVFSDEKGFIHTLWKANDYLLPQIQSFIDWSKDDGYEVELSFFPQDVNHKRFEIIQFIELVEEMRIVLQCDNYYVRYENASWTWYDESGLGVIYTAKDIPINYLANFGV
nr:putative integron gene cassette protein [uncultured bacterium]